MKNFHILRVHGKTWVLEGWVHEKPMYRGGCLKRGAWTGARQWEVVFLRWVDTPMHTMG